MEQLKIFQRGVDIDRLGSRNIMDYPAHPCGYARPVEGDEDKAPAAVLTSCRIKLENKPR